MSEMCSVLVIPIIGPVKGFAFPKAVSELMAEAPIEMRDQLVRISKDGTEGYMLLDGDWSGRTVEGGEIHGPFENEPAARTFINGRAKRWSVGGKTTEEVQ